MHVGRGLNFFSRPWCRICGVPFNFRGQPAPDRNDVCGNCEGQPSLYGKLRSIAFYEPTLREAIHLFKYDKKHILIKSLIQLIQEHLPTDLPAADYDFLLPIPLHTRRYRERGFNQSESIAQGIAQVWNVPVRTDILFRIRDTAPQSSMKFPRRNAWITLLVLLKFARPRLSVIDKYYWLMIFLRPARQ